MEEQERAKSQARSQLESIIEMVDELTTSEEPEEIEQRIQEDPLSVQVRSDWEAPSENLKASEYNILLCTGGPAVRIIGDLDEYKYPYNARLQFQDWFTSWEDYPLNQDEEDSLTIYAQQFYYGE